MCGEQSYYKVITSDLKLVLVMAVNAKQAVHIYWMSVSDEEALEAENVTEETVEHFEPEYNEKDDIAIVRMDEVFAIATKE